ncbi:MAG TPA: ABC transporter permease [Phycisphaerales bacterium]|nr:ABC transporter permease [Phycisphaerales bacterium]
MRGTIPIWRRELAAYFRTPAGWIIMALFLVLAGGVFRYAVLEPGQPASLRAFFGLTWSLLLVLAPAISMRAFSEERRSGTLETLLTAPVAEAGVVAGKFLAALSFLCLMLAPTLAYVVVLAAVAEPDPGAVLAGYLGVVLLGMLYLSVGMLASAATSSQALAFLGPLCGLVALEIVRGQAGAFPPRVAEIVYAVSPSLRTLDFAKGVIDTAHVAFFLVTSFWFLAATTLLLHARRWR